jgi:hypothetical protein
MPLAHRLLSPQLRGQWKFWTGFGRQHWIVEVPGTHAAVQFGDRRPTLQLTGGIPEGGYRLVRIIRKTDWREMYLASRGVFGMYFRDRDLREVEIVPAKDGVVNLRPAADLDPGEYMLIGPASPGQQWLMLGYPFGIAR